MRGPFLVGLLTISLVFAGCADAGAKETEEPASTVPTGSAVYDADEASASVAGVVTDDEKVPIAGVKVTLIELSLEVLSDEAGNYELKGVPLGQYKIGAAKLGYTSEFKSLKVVEDNETVKVDFLLQPIVIVESYMTTQIWQGKISCGILLVPVCGIFDELNQNYGTPNPTDEHWLFNWTYAVPDPPVMMVTEMDWKPSIPNTASKLIPSILVDGDIVQDQSGTSPIKIVSDEAQLKDWFKKDKKLGVYPELADPVIDQRFTIYRSDFFGTPPAEDWTVYPG